MCHSKVVANCRSTWRQSPVILRMYQCSIGFIMAVNICNTIVHVKRLNIVRVDSGDMKTKFEGGQGRWTKNCDVLVLLYLTVINYWFQIFRSATSPKQWYLQIVMLDIWMSVKHIKQALIHRCIPINSVTKSLWTSVCALKNMVWGACKCAISVHHLLFWPTSP